MTADPVKSAKKILSLSGYDFQRWLDRVIGAGLKIAR